MKCQGQNFKSERNSLSDKTTSLVSNSHSQIFSKQTLHAVHFIEAWFCVAIFVQLNDSTVLFWMFKCVSVGYWVHRRAYIYFIYHLRECRLFKWITTVCTISIIVFNLQFRINFKLYALHCTSHVLPSNAFKACRLYVQPSIVYTLRIA